MKESALRTTDVIYIITNKQGQIEYANVENQLAYIYLRKIRDFEDIKSLPMKSFWRNFLIYIDTLYIDNDSYYITIIVPEYYKCDSCNKGLIDIATGLYNRNYWEKFIKGTINHLEIENFSLIFIDIDNLKEINDSFGHLVGDRAIKIVGESIKKSIRKGDVAIRYGGDEFVILLENSDEYIAKKVINRIEDELYQRRKQENIDVHISIGASYDGSLENIKEMIKLADEDLYRKKAMKNRY